MLVTAGLRVALSRAYSAIAASLGNLILLMTFPPSVLITLGSN